MTEFGAAEVSSGIARLMRTGDLTAARALETFNAFDAFRRRETIAVEITAADYIMAHAHVRRFELNLRTPDALHLAVAQRLDLALVTLDKKLAFAARALGANVEQPS